MILSHTWYNSKPISFTVVKLPKENVEMSPRKRWNCPGSHLRVGQKGLSWDLAIRDFRPILFVSWSNVVDNATVQIQIQLDSSGAQCSQIVTKLFNSNQILSFYLDILKWDTWVDMLYIKGRVKKGHFSIDLIWILGHNSRFFYLIRVD